MEGKRFRYPSYVEDIMGDIFSLGFGPFRCLCLLSIQACRSLSSS